MHSTKILFSSLLFSSLEVHSTETPAILREWAAYSGISDSTFKTPVLTENDYTYVATVEENTVSGADIVVVKYNNNGIASWKQPWTGAGLGRDQAADMVMDSLYLYVCGTTYSSATNFDYVVIKMQKANGAIEWTKTFNGTANNYDIATAIAINDSSIYVTGVTSSLNTLLDYHTLKYHINGTLLWSLNFDYNNLLDIPFAISYSQEDSNIVVTGGSQSSIYDWDYQTNIYKYNGTTVDLGRVSGTSVGFDRATAVKTDSLVNIYITGATRENNSNFDIKTVKLDKLGNLIWQRTFDNNGGNDIANDLVVNNDGEIYLVGTIEGNGSDYLVMRLDASNGGIVWQNTIDCGANDTARAICFDSHGNIVITGQAFNPENSNYDFLTVNFDRAGQELWRDYFDGPDHGDDNATNIASDNDGNIFVTGQTWVGNDFHTVTIKYKTDFFTQPPIVDSPSVSSLFYPNQGQLIDSNDSLVTDSVHYYTLHHYPQLYFGYGTMNMVWGHVDTIASISDTLQRIDVSFLGSGNPTEAYPVNVMDSIGYLNYYLAHCPNGINNVRGSGSLLFTDIYSGIDAIYSSNNAGLKLAFICNPGSNPQEIGLAFAGDNGISVINNWELKLHTLLGDYAFEKPRIYQLDANGNRITLPWHLNWNVLQSGEANFLGWGGYDVGKTLVVEVSRSSSIMTPMPDNADWGTFLGGTGDDGIIDNCVDDSHYYYVCGFTYSTSFPGATGITIAQNFLNGGSDAFLSKFNIIQEIEWTTYYGGSSNNTCTFGGASIAYWNGDDVALGITTDHAGRIFVVGVTSSDDFPLPTSNPMPGGYFQDYYAGEPDGIIVQFNGNGSRHWASRYGGNTKENIHSIVVDNSNHFFVCGTVAGSVEDPHTPAFPYPHSFLLSSSCQASTTPNNLFTLGLPLCNSTSGYYDTYLPNSIVRKGFIAKFDLNSKALLHSTLFGGTGEAWIQDLAIDENSNKLAIIGHTTLTTSLQTCSVPTAGEFPLCDIGGYFQTVNSIQNTSDETGFIAQFDQTLNLEWSTFFGACDDIKPTHLAFNSQFSTNNADLYITGYSNSSNNILATTQCIETNNCAFPLCDYPNGFFRDHFDHSATVNLNVKREIFLSRFDVNRNIVWSTFYGGSGDDFNNQVALYDRDANADIAIDPNDNVYIFSTSKNETSNNFGDVHLEFLSGYYQDNQNTSPFSGKRDAILAVFNPNNQILWSTYIGGEGHEFGTSICLDGSDYLYVSGIIDNSSLPFASSLLTGTDLSLGTEYVQPPPSTTSSDIFNGFIWRFNMIGNPIGIQEITKQNNLQIFPNPSNNFITVVIGNSMIKSVKELEITNMLGQKVFHEKLPLNSNTIPIDIRAFSNGLYNIRITDKATTMNAKFIVAR